eukprot:gene11294-biopygen19874
MYIHAHVLHACVMYELHMYMHYTTLCTSCPLFNVLGMIYAMTNISITDAQWDTAAGSDGTSQGPGCSAPRQQLPSMMLQEVAMTHRYPLRAASRQLVGRRHPSRDQERRPLPAPIRISCAPGPCARVRDGATPLFEKTGKCIGLAAVLRHSGPQIQQQQKQQQQASVAPHPHAVTAGRGGDTNIPTFELHFRHPLSWLLLEIRGTNWLAPPSPKGRAAAAPLPVTVTVAGGEDADAGPHTKRCVIFFAHSVSK